MQLFKYINPLSVKLFACSHQYSGDVAPVGGGGPGGPKGATISVSNIRDIVFYECSQIKGTRNITIFTVYATIFGQFMENNYIRETDHFKLDLLKRADT